MSTPLFDDAEAMRRALELAARGLGRVEPNPPVGAVLVDAERRVIGEGFHEQFGGPHAEIHALQAAGAAARGGTLYVTLEPCCHFGKTGPCTEAILKAGVSRVVVATIDPAPHAGGKGIEILRRAGIAVDVGVCEREAARLIAPFAKLITRTLPYVHAKWAMSLDGKIATQTGDSRWISGELSRARVHQLRARVDAIIVGAETARIDNPLLTARPEGPRVATRIVIDSQARLSLDSQLVRTAKSVPVLVATAELADSDRSCALRAAGIEVASFPTARMAGGGNHPRVDLAALLEELGRRQMTNVLVEGGGTLLGGFFDQRLVDYAHVFIAPKIIGGEAATPVAGLGVEAVSIARQLDDPEIETIGPDVYIHGPLRAGE